LVEKVQKELDSVLGPSHVICYEDRKKLPYTNAVIHEIIRYGSIVLITIPREAVKDTTVLGYQIPKVQISFLFQCDIWPWVRCLSVRFAINPFTLQFRTDGRWWQRWQTALSPPMPSGLCLCLEGSVLGERSRALLSKSLWFWNTL